MAGYLSALAEWTCSCQVYKDTRDFLIKNISTMTSIDCFEKDPGSHVKKFLDSFAHSLSTWSFNYKESPPLLYVRHTLTMYSDIVARLMFNFQMEKPDELCDVIQWRTKYTTGIAMFKGLGSKESEIRDILGPKYDRVKSASESPESRSLITLLP
jgi:hypothetical protein